MPGAVASRIARAHAERINAIQRYFVEDTRLGIPIIPFDEAVHGLTRPGATVFPQAIALAASWDVQLMEQVAAAIARETRSRGIRQVLSPVLNIADDVRWGRVEETYGEDPYLASAMGTAFVRAFEGLAVITTPKHLVANVGEGGRDSYPIQLSERVLFERYLPPFEAALRAGARSVMTAYNSVDGLPATQNPRLLNGILKGAWGFEGFVISDAAATGGATVLHMTEPDTPTAAQHAWQAGLDVVFQSRYGQQRPYLAAVQRGLVDESVIDAAVLRVLRAKLALGLFEDPYVDPGRAASLNGNAAHGALARAAARAGTVLLKNDPGALPLSASARLAIIGEDAAEARLGGYSGPGVAPVSIVDGIRAHLPSASAMRYEPGPGRLDRELVVVPESAFGAAPAATAEQPADPAGERASAGVSGTYFDNITLAGEPIITRTDPRIDFRWTLNSPGRGVPFDWYSARWTGTMTVPPEGVAHVGIEGNDGYRLWLDGELVIDDWQKLSYGRRVVPVDWQPGSSHALRLEFFESTGIARLRLLWDAGVVDDAERRIAAAVRAADAADAAIVVAGVEEGEFRDRAFLGLPGRQEELIRRVAATGTPTIVVLIGGSAITMPWLNDVAGVLDAWYPGEQGGNGIADVLFGDADPGGRLPITFPMAAGQLPLYYNHKPTGRGDDYVDLTGMPLFPFGHGLSYTTFAYSDLRIEPAAIAPDGSAIVRATVTNSGDRAGSEVAQLYVRDVLASVARPVQELEGFERVHLAPGESAEVSFRLGPEELRMLDADMEWVVEPGAFRIQVGRSSEDIRLRGELEVRSN
jgi:beta-glucosidase